MNCRSVHGFFSSARCAAVQKYRRGTGTRGLVSPKETNRNGPTCPGSTMHFSNTHPMACCHVFFAACCSQYASPTLALPTKKPNWARTSAPKIPEWYLSSGMVPYRYHSGDLVRRPVAYGLCRTPYGGQHPAIRYVPNPLGTGWMFWVHRRGHKNCEHARVEEGCGLAGVAIPPLFHRRRRGWVSRREFALGVACDKAPTWSILVPDRLRPGHAPSYPSRTSWDNSHVDSVTGIIQLKVCTSLGVRPPLSRWFRRRLWVCFCPGPLAMHTKPLTVCFFGGSPFQRS